MIVNGIKLHSVIGRRIFETWYIARNLLEDRTNGIQDRIADVILGGGKAYLQHGDAGADAQAEAKTVKYPFVLRRNDEGDLCR